MEQQTADPGWQLLQAHLQRFLAQFLGEDTKKIEYKPQFVVPLLEMPAEVNQGERSEWV